MGCGENVPQKVRVDIGAAVVRELRSHARYAWRVIFVALTLGLSM